MSMCTIENMKTVWKHFVIIIIFQQINNFDKTKMIFPDFETDLKNWLEN